MNWRDIDLNRWRDRANDRPTYKTVLSPRTLVLVETTDCDDYGWNVCLNKNCCVLRKELIFVNATAFISSSHRTTREVFKEIQGIKECSALVYFMGERKLV